MSKCFSETRQACGGEQDVDANATNILAATTPVETIFWSDPPPGTYKVTVDPFDMREGRTLGVPRDSAPGR